MAVHPSIRKIFMTGGTGYMGRHLIPELLRRRHIVTALLRPGSERKLVSGCSGIVGNALDETTYAKHVPPADTFVHLVGVPNPNPWKAEQFRRIDLVSVCVAISAAMAAEIRHFVYISVAQPAPVMKAYVQIRGEAEALIKVSRLNATILRPWYVLGPGHRWPYALLPVYWVLERLPATRNSAQRLGLVTIAQMVEALLWAIENPCEGIRIIEVPQIRRLTLKR